MFVVLVSLALAAPADKDTAPAAVPTAAPVAEEQSDLKASSTYGLGYGLGYGQLGYAPKIVAPVGYGYGGLGQLGYGGYGAYGGYGKGTYHFQLKRPVYFRRVR